MKTLKTGSKLVLCDVIVVRCSFGVSNDLTKRYKYLFSLGKMAIIYSEPETNSLTEKCITVKYHPNFQYLANSCSIQLSVGVIND